MARNDVPTCLEVLVLTRTGEIRDTQTACNRTPARSKSYFNGAKLEFQSRSWVMKIPGKPEYTIAHASEPWKFDSVTCQPCKQSAIWFAVRWLEQRGNHDRYAVWLDALFEAGREGIAKAIVSQYTERKDALSEADDLLRRYAAEQATLRDGRIRSWWTWGQPNTIHPNHVTFVAAAQKDAELANRLIYEMGVFLRSRRAWILKARVETTNATLAALRDLFGEESDEESDEDDL